MKNRSIARILSMLLVVLMFSSVIGCADTTQSKKESTLASSEAATTKGPGVDDKGTGLEMSDVKNMTAPGVLPIVVEPVTITFAFAPNSTVTDYNENDWTKWLEEKTGINIEFFPLPNENPSQKIELMVASGQELPDIVNSGLSNVSVDSFYKSGIILPLEDMMNKYCYYWNDMMKKWVTEDEAKLMDMYSRTYDGTRLKFPLVYTDPSSVYSATQTIWIRDEWLKATGKAVPTTTDELYDVLKAFRDQDPNKNKKKDEIPLIATPVMSTVSGANSGIDPLLSAFIYCFYAPSKSYLNSKDGKLYIPAATDEYREGLRYVNKLVSEKLLSTQSFTSDSDQLKAMLNLGEKETPYVGAFIAHPTSTLTANPDDIGKYSPVFPLTGPKGVYYSHYTPGVTYERTIITKYCKNPEIAVRLLDYFCEEETMIRGRWGVKGRDWEPVTDKTIPAIYPSMGLVPVYKTINNPYAGSNSIIWKMNAIAPIPSKLFASRTAPDGESTEMEKLYMERSYKLLADKQGKQDPEFVPKLTYTADEEKSIGEIGTSLMTYIVECQTRFALGEMSVEKDWDTYLKTLESIGMSEFIKVSQVAYERMK